MSRLRMAFFVVLFLALGAVVGALAASTSQPSLDELIKQVEALTKRVEQLEEQLQAVKAGARPSDALEQEARGAFAKVNQLIGTGKIDEARVELDAFMKKYGSTRIGKQASRLPGELAVIGKDTPSNWGIERWFQGEDQIDLASDKPTVVVFWETWCPHCRREVPKLQRVYRSYKDKGMQLIRLTKVNKSATEEAVESFIADNKLEYPIAKENGSMSAYFGVRGVPAAAVVKDGKVIWRGHPVRITDDMLKGWL